MPSPRPHTSPKSPLTLILVWAFLLGVFWAIFLTVSQSPLLDTDDANAHAGFAIEAQTIKTNGDVLTDFDESKEPMLLTITKQVFTFVSENIIQSNASVPHRNSPVATIGIRG